MKLVFLFFVKPPEKTKTKLEQQTSLSKNWFVCFSCQILNFFSNRNKDVDDFSFVATDDSLWRTSASRETQAFEHMQTKKERNGTFTLCWNKKTAFLCKFKPSRENWFYGCRVKTGPRRSLITSLLQHKCFWYDVSNCGHNEAHLVFVSSRSFIWR